MGPAVGSPVGAGVGAREGLLVGLWVGTWVGNDEGPGVGLVVGLLVGAGVGTGMRMLPPSLKVPNDPVLAVLKPPDGPASKVLVVVPVTAAGVGRLVGLRVGL